MQNSTNPGHAGRLRISRISRILRMASVAVLGGMLATGILQQGFGLDTLAHLPDVDLCLVHALGDLSCPGCGMLRALLCLGQLRFAEATSFHPLSLPCALAMGWLAIGSPGRTSLLRVSSALQQRAVVLALLIVVGLYCVRLVGGTLPD
jgi:hypothetical protein